MRRAFLLCQVIQGVQVRKPLSLSPTLGALTQHGVHLAVRAWQVPVPRLISVNSTAALAPK